MSLTVARRRSVLRAGPMKVAVVMPLAVQRGGAEIELLRLLTHSRDLDVSWSVAFLEDGPMVEAARALGHRVAVLRAGRLRQLHRYAFTVGRLARQLHSWRPDLVLCWMPKAHLYGGIAAILAGLPSVWRQVGIPHKSNWLDRVAAQIPARAVITPSNEADRAQRLLSRRMSSYPVTAGIDLCEFDSAQLPDIGAARTSLGLPEAGPIIGIVGRLQRWKGMHTLIAAMPEILAVWPNALCVVVGGSHAGEPDYLAYLQRTAASLGVQHHIRFAGFQEEIPMWMHAMDIVVHASDREPFGIVVIEAMALGKPVVAGASGGPLEVITDGVDGLLTPFEDPHGLAQAVLRYLSDQAFSQRIGEAAKERSQHFSIERYTENMVQVLHTVRS